MNDDIKAIRDALAALWPASRNWQADQLSVWKSDGDELADCDTPETAAYIAAVHPERIARLLDALEAAQKDAERYRWMRSRQVECTPHVAIAEHAAERFDRHIDAAMKGSA